MTTMTLFRVSVLAVLLSVAGLTGAQQVQQQNLAPHQHGKAHLSVAVEGNTVQIEMESPMDSLIGFEHPARTPKEKLALEQLQSKLKDPSLFALTPQAQCRLSNSTAASALFTPASAATASAHTDLEASWTYQCKAPEALKRISLAWFRAFPHTHAITAELVTAQVQKSFALTAKNNSLQW